jgi:hypothetical protein
MSKAPKYILNRRKTAEVVHHQKEKLAPSSRIWWQRFSGSSRAIIKVLGVLFTILGAVATVLSLYPRFSVDSQALSDPTDPFSVPFVITNDGLLPLSDLGYAIHVKKLVDANEKTFPHQGQSSIPDLFIMADSDPKWATLYAGDKATIIPHPLHSHEFQFSVPLRRGELEVVTFYRYGIWPFRRQRRYSFVAITVAGQQTWTREPRSD